MSAGKYGDTVTTYADGFGLWHAVISCRDGGYGNAGEWNLDRHWSRLRAMARRAIRRELAVRSEASPDYALRLDVHGVREFGTGVVYRVEFVERGAE